MCQGSSYPVKLTNKEHNLLEFLNVHLVFERGGKPVGEIKLNPCRMLPGV